MGIDIYHLTWGMQQTQTDAHTTYSMLLHWHCCAAALAMQPGAPRLNSAAAPAIQNLQGVVCVCVCVCACGLLCISGYMSAERHGLCVICVYACALDGYVDVYSTSRLVFLSFIFLLD